MEKTRILIIVGSLRKKSFNLSIAHSFVALGSENVNIEIADISAIPLYNQDLEESSFPDTVTYLKNTIKDAHGVIIVTPEYNRSIPGVLKNVIDWVSRPTKDSAWREKPVAITGATNGAIGTAVAQVHLKQIMTVVGAHVMGQPELYINEVVKKSDTSGNLTDETTRERMTTFLEMFLKLVQKFK